MLQFVRAIFALLLPIIFLGLSACGMVRPMSLEPEQLENQALIFGVVSRIEDLREYTGQALFFGSAGSEEPLHQLTASETHKYPEGVDARNQGLEYLLIARLVPPGDYYFSGFKAFIVAGYGSTTWSRDLEEPVTFTVEAGKAYYVGNHAFVPRVDEIIFGHQVPHEPYVLSMNNPDEDIALARRIYPNLPPVEVVDGMTAMPFDAQKVFTLAREINPDLEMWKE